MRKQDLFGISWFIDPTEADWHNADLGGVRRILLGYSLAKNHALLARIAATGRSVVLRIEEDTPDTNEVIALNLRQMKESISVSAVILGNEWDAAHGVNWHYGSPDWQQNGMYANKWRVAGLRSLVRGLGLRAVSPALSHPPEQISEDGLLNPGRATFEEISRIEYDLCDGNAAHIYALGWGSIDDVNELRFKFALKHVAETWHKNLWIDEVGVLLDTDVAQMSAYCRMADILLKHPAGQRTEFFCPFVSAGYPDGSWDKRYLLKDEAAYRQLGRWMAT